MQLNVTRADIKDVARQGNDLLVTLSNGQVVTVRSYFLKLDGLQSSLVLEDDLEGLWQLNLGGGADASGSVPFGFTSLQSIDPLLSEPGPSDERDAVLGVWHAALAALTIGAMMHDGNGSHEQPVKPNVPQVDPVNGVDPIIGIADPGTTVRVTMPDGSTATATVGSDGRFSVPNPGLKDHDEITVVAVSSEGVDSDPVTVVVDAKAPDAPVVEPVNATDPIVGHAEPGSTLTVKLPSGSTLSAVVDTDGNFTIPNQGLHDGDTISVTATDAAGNVSDATKVVVDGLAPALTITDDVAGIVGADGSVTFTFTFSENVKNFDASKVQVSGGVAGQFVAISGSVYALVVTPNETASGEVKVTVPAGAAQDAAGNPSTAAEASQSVDTVAPAKGSLYDIVLMDDVGSVTGEIKSGDQTDDSKPTFTGKANPKEVALVQIYDNGKVIGNAVVQADGTWSFEPKLPLASGPHSFQAEPIDAAGNVGEQTDALPFELDGPAPAAPAITGVYDDAGTITGNIQKGYPTDDTKPTLEGTGTPGTVVKVWDGSVLVGSTEVDANGNWVIVTDALGDGEHKLTATATDGAGQVSPSTGEYLVLVDTTPPATPDMPSAYDDGKVVAGPGSEDVTLSTANPVLSGKGESGEKVSLYDKGSLIGTTTVGTDGAWTYVPATGLTQGAHEITVTLTDKAGNTSASSDGLNFTIDTSTEPLTISYAQDDVAPLIEPVPNGGSTDDVTPTLVGIAPAGSTVTVHEGDKVLGTALTDANGHWSLALPEQGEGTHNYVAQAQNAAGTQLTAKFDLTIDVSAPTVPAIEAVGDDVGTVQVDLAAGASTDDTTPTIHGNGAAGEQINIYDNGMLIGSTEVGGDGNWHYTVNPPLTTEGEHVLTATAVDSVGNESSASEPFVITLDVTPPDVSKVELSVEKVAGDDYVNIAESQGNMTLTGKLQNVPSDVVGSKVIVTVGGADYEATLSGDTWTASVPGSVLAAGGDGLATLVVEAILSDAAGNSAQLQVSHDYTVDTTTIPTEWEDVAAALWDDVDPVQGEIISGMATNDSKPVYKGIASASAGVAYVEILDHGVVIGQAQVQPDGSWSFEPDVALSKGDHEFQARPADAAGNTGVATTAVDFIVEGPQPQPPAIEDVQDNVGTVTGNIQKGVPTDDASPTLSGTAERGTVVKVFDVVDGNRVQVGETAVNDAGQWTIEVSALADGAHHLIATATDAAGQESDATGEYLVQVDTSVPTTSMAPVALDNVGDQTGPINSGDITDDANPEFKGTAEVGTLVKIYDNDKLIGSTTAGTNGEWSYTPASGLADGEHSITVTLTDAAGNASLASDPLTFGVNTEGLELVVQQVLDDQGDVVGLIANGGSTDDPTPTFVGKATPGATLTIFEGSNALVSSVADANGNWTLSLPEQSDGAHAYVVSAISTSGNTVTEQFTLTVDTAAPPAPSIGGVTDDVGSNQGPLTNGGVTDDTTPTLAGIGTAGETINVYDNGSLVGSTTVDANGNWTLTLNPALTSEGAHELTATSVDAVGNESSSSEPFVVNLDVTPPDVTNVQLTVNTVTEDNIVNAAESALDVTLTGTISGVPSDVVATKVDVVVNGKHYEGVVNGDAWSVSVPGSALVADSDSQLEVGAKFVDAAGNSAQKTSTQIYVVDTTAPNPNDILFDHALMDDVGDKQGEILAGDVTDDSKPTYQGKTVASEVAKVLVLDNGLVIAEGTVQADGSWSAEPKTALGAGPHSFQLQAVDAAGNASLPTDALDFTVAGAAPQAPSITGVYDDMGANIQPNQPTNDATPMLEGTATLGTEVKVYEITTDGERILVGSATVDGQGQWSINTENLSDGIHNLIATATDGAGQESVATGVYPVSVDTIAPDQPGMVQAIDGTGDKTGALVDGETTDDSTPEFKGSGEAGTTVTVYDGSVVVGSATVGESGQWSLTPAKGLEQGNHSITVTLMDEAGNISQPSEPLAFSVGTEGVELLIDQVLDDQGDIKGPIANGGFTDDKTPTFVGKATAGAMVTILEGSTPLTSIVADADGNWSVSLPEQGEGAHAYTINALSVSGNTATAQFALTVDVTVPEPPSIGGVGDDVGTVQGPMTNGGVTDDTTPSLSGSGTPGDTINVHDNGSLVGSTTVGTDGNWAYTVNPAFTNEGEHELTATSIDVVGNESTASGSFVIQLDVTPPDTSNVQLMVNPVTDDNVINGTEQTTDITLSGTLSNLPADVAASIVSVNVNGKTYDAVLDGNSWSVVVAGSELVTDPDHKFEVTAMLSDAAGNTAQIVSDQSYETKLAGPAASTIHNVVVTDDIGDITGAITNGGITDDTKPTVTGNADYPEVARVDVLDNGEVIGHATVNSDGTWSFEPAEALDVGDHSLQFRPVDAAGNVGESTTAIAFELAGDAPEPPVIGGMDGEDLTGTEDQAVTDVTTNGVVDASTDAVDTSTESGDAISETEDITTSAEDSVTKVEEAATDVDGTVMAGTGNAIANTDESATALADTVTPEGETANTVGQTEPAVDNELIVGDLIVAENLLNTDQVITQADMKTENAMESATTRAQSVATLVTNDTTPTLKGTAVAGTTVKLYDISADGTKVLVGSTIASAQGTWTITSTLLTESTHSFIATSTDAAGQISAPSVSFQLIVDITPPVKPAVAQIMDNAGDVVGAVSNGGVTDDANAVIKGTGEVGAKVKVYDNGKLVGSAVVDAEGQWSLQPTTALAEGNHSITTTQTDKAGNVSASSDAATFMLDTTPVTLTVSQVTDDVGTVTGEIVSGAATDDAKPTFTGLATAGSTVTIYEADQAILSTTADAKGQWTIELPQQADGVHVYTVQAVNASGNVAKSEFSLEVDTTAPVVPEIDGATDNVGPDQGMLVSGSMTDDATPTLTGTGTPGSSIIIEDNGNQIGTVVVDGEGHWSYTVEPPLTEGEHEITATGVDAVGNESEPSVDFTFTLDTTPPSVANTKLSVNNVTDDNIVNQTESQADVSITGTLTGIPVDSTNTTVVVTVNGTEYAATLNGDVWTASVPGSALLADTDLTLDVRATFTDAAGNAATLDVSKAYTTDSTPPVVTDASLTVNNVTDDNIVNQAESQTDVAITGALKGEPADSASTKVIVTVNGTDYEASVDGETWSVNVPGSALLSDSDLTVDVKATFTDAAGNAATLDASKTYTTDSTPPVVTDAALTVNNVTDDNVVNMVESLADVNVNGTLKGVPTDSASTKVVVTVNGTDYEATVDGEAWSASVPGGALLSDSDLTVDVKATFTDSAGNASTLDASKTYATDSTPPVVTDASLTVNNVTDDNVINQAESKADVSITGTLTGVPADSVTTKVVVTVDGTEYEATLNGDAWSTNVPGSVLLSDADLTLDVKASFTDEAGNVATLEVSKTYQAKAEPPVLTSVHDMALYDDVGEIQGPVLTGGITDDHQPIYSGQASYPEVTVVQILDKGTLIGETQVNSDGSWSFEPTVLLSEGTHSLQARPVDFAGNVGTASDVITFLVAGDAPTSPIISGMDEEEEAAASMDLSTIVPAADSVQADSTATVADDVAAQLVNDATVTETTAVASAYATRAAALTTQIVPTASTTAAVLPGSADVVTNDTTPTLKGTAIAGTYVKLYIQDSASEWVLVGQTVADANGKWSITNTSVLAEGTYRYMATSTDASGQVSAPSTEFTLQVDITAPATMPAPTAMDDVGTVVGVIADGGATDDTQPAFSGTGEPGAKVTVYDNGASIGTAVVGSDGQWSFTPAAALSEGAHSIHTTQRDTAGNTSVTSEVLHFTVDTVAPQVGSSIHYVDNVGAEQGQFDSGTTTDDRTVSLTGALSQALQTGDEVVIYEDGNRLGVAVVTGNNWTFALPGALANDSAHTYSVQITDAAGNVTTAGDITVNVALSMGVNSLNTDDNTPLIVGTIGGELLAGEHVEVTINGITYSSQTGAVAVDAQNSIWYVQVPDSDRLNVGSHHVVTQLVDSTGSVVVEASGNVGIETEQVDETSANTNWATALGDVTNNTLVFGLNDDGLWTIAANRHAYSSTDLSSYTSSVLGNVQGQSTSRTVVSMTSADVDRNGTSDVFGTENKYEGEYQIMWKNSGNGYAAQKQSVGDETIYWGAVIAYDKTGDGYLDLAYGDRYGNSVTYLANNGGTLVPDGNKNGDAGMTKCDQESFGEVSGVDINGDGDVDIVRHDDALGNYTLSVINNNGTGKLSVGQSIDDVFYKNEKDSTTAASMTWADFNGDGTMDLYLASGKNGVGGMIYYNDGTGLLSTSGAAVESTTVTTRNSVCSTNATGFLSVAVDWNHDGQMDIVKFSNYASSQTAKLYSNSGTGAWSTSVLSSTLSNVTGIAAMDYNWDGAKDLIVSQQNGKIVYIENTDEVVDGTALHLQIVDSEGVNVYYGNTVQLFDSKGQLVAAQILNAQSGYGVNDTSGLVSFYGLDASETYTATLLKVTNGTSSNVSWDGLVASDGTDAYALSATASTGVTSGILVGTGYNDTFVAESGAHTYDGSGGWSASGNSETWSNTGGLDVVDFRSAGSAVVVELGSTAVQGNSSIKATLVDIEGVAGSEYGDKLIGSAGNDWIEGRGGNDTIVIASGGKDTLAYHELNASDAVGGNGSDVVTGFKVGSWEAMTGTDRIDLSELLQGYSTITGGDSAAMYIDGVATINAGDTISKYLKVNTTAAGSEIQVDAHGDGVDYTTVVTLTGVQTDLATMLANHQITLI